MSARRRKKSRALKEIQAEQRKTNLIIPFAPFNRVINELVAEQSLDIIGVKREARDALQTEAENYLIELFQDANKLAVYNRRETLLKTDLDMVRSIKGHN